MKGNVEGREISTFASVSGFQVTFEGILIELDEWR